MYTVRQVADLAGVTVRTLHHYDEIGLLHPAVRTKAGYRLYGREELLQLQQILFFRELDMPLSKIRAVMDGPDFDHLAALEAHRHGLRARLARLQSLIDTVEKTIDTLRGDYDMLTDKDLYEGFDREAIEQYETEARNRWPAEYAEVDNRVRSMSKRQWRNIQDEGEAIARALAQHVGADPTSEVVQELVARHHAWIENFYEADAARYAGLADMYIADDRFAGFYDKYAQGLAELLSRAMRHFAESRLA